MTSARRAKTDYWHYINNEEEFEARVNETSQKLTIVDVHLSWCGPCILMQKIFQQMALRIDEWEARIEFLICDIEKVPYLSEH
jgi:hypothetical protein